IDSELAVLELDRYGIAASSGAACSSGECEDGSHVIIALGKSKSEASRSVRFSLGRLTSKSDLDYVVKILKKVINKHTNLWK
ncbi:MAG: cysteine desulfurase NifS, partial [Patescibacteria group bacterium]